MTQIAEKFCGGALLCIEGKRLELAPRGLSEKQQTPKVFYKKPETYREIADKLLL